MQQRLIALRNRIFPAAPQALYDRQIVWIVLMLMSVGFVMVTSASIPVSLKLTDGASMFSFSIKHGIFLIISVLVTLIATKISVKQWQQLSVVILLLSMGLLVAVLLFGHSVNGATRWIRVPGFFNIQPAEIAKLSVFIFIAGYLERRQTEVIASSWGFVKPLFIFAVLGLLLLLQPDLGSMVVMLITILAMLFIAGAKLWQFIALVLVGLVLIAFLIWLEPYRMARVTSFWDPWEHAFSTGYQLTQSLMAFGRGDWLGQGLGNSILKLAYLPEAHTDFVFAVIAEELGLVGVSLVLILLFTLVIKAMLIGRRSLQHNQLFSGFLAFAIGVWFAFQGFVNVGAAAGLLPTKGLTFPFVSYGGSSLMIMSVAVAILLRIDYEYRLEQLQALPSKK